MRVDNVLKSSNLKKGALYHHFPGKKALGYAVLEECIQKRITELWIEPLQNFTDPLDGIYALYTELDNAWTDEFFSLGCPLNNLAQEMSPIDDGFRIRIENFFSHWKLAISKALKQGQN